LEGWDKRIKTNPWKTGPLGMVTISKVYRHVYRYRYRYIYIYTLMCIYIYVF
jgi:hypothetical protein